MSGARWTGGPPADSRDAAPETVVHIDELDLSGVPVARRPAVAAAFQRELARLLTDQPLDPDAAAGLDAANAAPTLAIALDGPPERVGAAIAASVHARLRGRS